MTVSNILITGAAGFIGTALATRLLSTPEYHLILTDNAAPSVPPGVVHPEHATCITADLCDPAAVSSLVTAALPLRAVFIFHGIMSSGSEADPALSYRVNYEATRQLLLCLAAAQRGVRVIFSSSCAVYGQPLPAVVTDATTPTPQGTYGTHKLMVEMLLNEMTRRGELEAFSLRFPTISVRPGRPTQAASSFFSGMIREPLAGQVCELPIRDRNFRVWLCGPRTLVDNLVRVLALEAGVLPPHVRRVLMPGMSVSIGEMMAALETVAGVEKLALLRDVKVEDRELVALLRSWPVEADCSTAMGWGLRRDESFEDVVREYVLTLAH